MQSIPKPEQVKIKHIKISGQSVKIGPDAVRPTKGLSSEEFIKKLKKASKEKIFPMFD